jgi:hypothetical protein
MDKHPQLDFYLKTLDDRQSEVQARIRSLMEALVGSDQSRKIARAGEALQSIKDLLNLLPSGNKPGWVDQISQRLTELINGQSGGNTPEGVWSHVYSNFDEIFRKKLSQYKPDLGGVDFDALYRTCYESSKIPSLFDELVRTLQQVIESDAIDSRRVVKSLESLIALLRKNRNGSYFSTFSTTQVVCTGLRNIFFEVLKDVPGIAGVIRGVETSCQELQIEWGQFNEELKTKVREAFSFNLTGLDSKYYPLLSDERMDDAERTDNGNDDEPRPPV